MIHYRDKVTERVVTSSAIGRKMASKDTSKKKDKRTTLQDFDLTTTLGKQLVGPQIK